MVWLLLARDDAPSDVFSCLPRLRAKAELIWTAGYIEYVAMAGHEHSVVAAGILCQLLDCQRANRLLVVWWQLFGLGWVQLFAALGHLGHPVPAKLHDVFLDLLPLLLRGVHLPHLRGCGRRRLLLSRIFLTRLFLLIRVFDVRKPGVVIVVPLWVVLRWHDGRLGLGFCRLNTNRLSSALAKLTHTFRLPQLPRSAPRDSSSMR
mmetsp:Transcript_55349/g.103848  ORF Transcript_55349/g.103848 Transcript_55349/m.103848 type:complete len:205 (+) Transcript_55349:268-882(+)